MELLERELYLDTLNSAFADVSSGTGRVVLVSGEAGIGKTALIQQFVAGHGNTGRTLWGECAALFAPQPLAPLYDMARQAGGELAASLAAAPHRAAIFDATIAAPFRFEQDRRPPCVSRFIQVERALTDRGGRRRQPARIERRWKAEARGCELVGAAP